MYRNPAFESAEGPGTSQVSRTSSTYMTGVPEGRQELLPGELRRSVKFSAGEKMMISITGDQAEHIFSDRLLIPVQGAGGREEKAEQEQFDPDTLERREGQERPGRGRQLEGKPGQHSRECYTIVSDSGMAGAVPVSDSRMSDAEGFSLHLFSSSPNPEGKKGRVLFQ